MNNNYNYYDRFPFSIVQNDGVAFPNMPVGELLVYGRHDQSIATCDYDGNMSSIHPNADAKANETDRLILLNNDRDSIMAWHGYREKQNPEFNNGRCFGRVNWCKALKDKFQRSKRRNRKR